MSWNWAYTKRKQKEMSEKSAHYQEGLKPLYREFGYSKPQNTIKWAEERERERRINIISVVMLSLLSIVFITIIAYFIKYGV